MPQSSISETWSQIEEELLKDEDEEGYPHCLCSMINSLNSEERLDYAEVEEGLNVISNRWKQTQCGLTLEGL